MHRPHARHLPYRAYLRGGRDGGGGGGRGVDRQLLGGEVVEGEGGGSGGAFFEAADFFRGEESGDGGEDGVVGHSNTEESRNTRLIHVGTRQRVGRATVEGGAHCRESVGR